MIVRCAVLVLALPVAMALGACSGKSEDTAVTTNVTAANFTPPSVTSRADFGARTERRFRRSDADGDGKVSAEEMRGKNGARRVKRFDTNGDGSLDSAEWGAMMLKQFDRQDTNNDGNVTSEERAAKRGNRGGKGKRERGGSSEIDADTDMDAETNTQ